MITFEQVDGDTTRVSLDGLVVGRIIHFPEGWQYRPRGHYFDAKFASEYFPTLQACKDSLR